MVTITWYLDHGEGAEGEPRVDSRQEKLVRVEQSGKTLLFCHPWAQSRHH